MPTYKVMRKVLGMSPKDIIVSDNPFYANMAAKGHLVIVPDEAETPVDEAVSGDTVNDAVEEVGTDDGLGDGESGEPAGRTRKRNREGTDPSGDSSPESGS